MKGQEIAMLSERLVDLIQALHEGRVDWFDISVNRIPKVDAHGVQDSDLKSVTIHMMVRE